MKSWINYFLLSFLLTMMAGHALVQADARKERRKFYLSMVKKEKAFFEDVTNMVYMLKFESFHEGTFEERVRVLKDEDILPESNDWQADYEPDRGELSYMLVRAMGIRGGIKMIIGIKNERYCYRECTYLNLFSAGGNQRRKISGAELIGVFDKCSSFLAEKYESKEKDK